MSFNLNPPQWEPNINRPQAANNNGRGSGGGGGYAGGGHKREEEEKKVDYMIQKNLPKKQKSIF